MKIYTEDDLREAFFAGTNWKEMFNKEEPLIGSTPIKVPDWDAYINWKKSKNENTN